MTATKRVPVTGTIDRPWARRMLGDPQVAERLRDAPTDGFVAEMRGAFRTESDVDAALTRKLTRRKQAPYRSTDLAAMQRNVENFLAEQVEGPFTVQNMRWLAGGASKIQAAFTLDWNDPDQGRITKDMVARIEPAESLNTTSRVREFQLANAVDGVIPIARAYWVDEAGAYFPEPTLISEFKTGVTKPSSGGRVSGVGSDFGPELRSVLGRQYVEHIARLHTHDPSGADLSAFDTPRLGSTDAAMWQVERARRVWEEDRGEELPILEVAANWLRREAPALDHVSLVHGDFRSGNFLFDEASGEITAWLDWERGHLGDRHRDLTWMALRPFGHIGDDGRFLVCGLVPIDEFYDRYQEASGLEVDPVRLHYYQVLNTFQLTLSVLGSGYRIVRLGKSHQDVLLAWVEGFGRTLVRDLYDALEKAN